MIIIQEIKRCGPSLFLVSMLSEAKIIGHGIKKLIFTVLANISYIG